MSFLHTQAVSIIHPEENPREYAVGKSTVKGMGQLRGTRVSEFMKAVAAEIGEKKPGTIEVHFTAEPGVRLPGDAVRNGEIIKLPKAAREAHIA